MDSREEILLYLRLGSWSVASVWYAPIQTDVEFDKAGAE